MVGDRCIQPDDTAQKLGIADRAVIQAVSCDLALQSVHGSSQHVANSLVRTSSSLRQPSESTVSSSVELPLSGGTARQPVAYQMLSRSGAPCDQREELPSVDGAEEPPHTASVELPAKNGAAHEPVASQVLSESAKRSSGQPAGLSTYCGAGDPSHLASAEVATPLRCEVKLESFSARTSSDASKVSWSAASRTMDEAGNSESHGEERAESSECMGPHAAMSDGPCPRGDVVAEGTSASSRPDGGLAGQDDLSFAHHSSSPLQQASHGEVATCSEYVRDSLLAEAGDQAAVAGVDVSRYAQLEEPIGCAEDTERTAPPEVLFIVQSGASSCGISSRLWI